MTAFTWRFGTLAMAASVALGACSNGNGATSAPPLASAYHRKSGSTPIQHIVLMIQENRSFNNLFATFPGATGTTMGGRPRGSGSIASTRGKTAGTAPICLSVQAGASRIHSPNLAT